MSVSKLSNRTQRGKFQRPHAKIGSPSAKDSGWSPARPLTAPGLFEARFGDDGLNPAGDGTVRGQDFLLAQGRSKKAQAAEAA